ncbi:MAG: Ig-like domain-containing protein [Isosphaeraceae bacterium]|nr:Ig-like domain-containing protein [Isosphaeraceae bacterium]
METTIPRRRRARVFSLAAVIALVALLLPATAAVVLGHTPKATLQCTNDVPTLQVDLTSYTESLTNLVSVTIDGVNDPTYFNYDFGSTFDHTWLLSPATSDHTATVVVLAGDDPTNQYGFSPTFNLSVPPCQIKADPKLPTTPSAGGWLGTMLNDSATVTGGNNPIGTVTFSLYGPGTSCDSDAIYTQQVSLDEGTVAATTSPGFEALAPGTYEWTATYSGDDYNNPASSGCGEEAVVISRMPTCQALGTCPSPSPSPLPSALPSPSVSPSPSPSPQIVSPSPSPQGSVEAATSKPRVTPPPTSSMGGTAGGPSNGIWFVLLALAGLIGSILLLTPAPVQARRRR